jgi:hypothetical protein
MRNLTAPRTTAITVTSPTMGHTFIVIAVHDGRGPPNETLGRGNAAITSADGLASSGEVPHQRASAQI